MDMPQPCLIVWCPPKNLICGVCGVDVVDGNGILLQGDRVEDHSCFHGYASIKVVGQVIVRVGNGLTQDAPSTNDANLQPFNQNSQGRLQVAVNGLSNQIVNLIPISQKRLHNSFKNPSLLQLPLSTAVPGNTQQLSGEALTMTSDENDNNVSPHRTYHQISSDGSYDESSSADTYVDQSTMKWSVAQTKLLLSTYSTLKDGLERGQFQTKKMLHRKICEEMKKHGHDVTPDQVQSKLRKLEDNFKKKRDNMGPNQSGAARLDVPFEDELNEAFEKNHAINPTHLLGVDWEYTRKNDSASDPDESEMGFSSAGERTSKKVDGDGVSKIASNNNEKDGEMEPCSKKKRYSMNIVMSESQRREKYHQDILSRKDQYIRLKSEELNLKMESKKKELEIKQESTKNFVELKKMELALKAQKIRAKYPNFSFDLPE
ncbi:hypothetical protein QAD02_015954 [Eretmocerus hayati]|uniref:Uncharacterized protein n=1 Tax=Eretmocerus hayati TaxID=131215 RepID=A0ACC2PA41_9HYME|nr:hypothetical protein QAD02_015954 [Eretmocerus hayati]